MTMLADGATNGEPPSDPLPSIWNPDQASLLVLNAGSSSLKFAVFAVNGSVLAQRYDGQMEGIGAAPHFILRDAAGARIAERQFCGRRGTQGP
jgi:hypothetical protein